ncbi:sigma-w pathway protein ysdB [Bacillus sp. SM2101]|uniref:sigma-w pathway protein ysdB n=1 Tax=Bacillaceae TaxID=186817 RepID=UPI001BDEFAB3|nr:sigma-w pathway protein ysdB [Bacillus sp. SM2101]
MFVLFIRLAIIVLLIFIIYRMVKYILNPKRKLELAHEQKKYFLLDNPNNVHKNFLLTYQGVLFEGEKYLGTTDKAFEVVSMFVWAKDVSTLQGLNRDDFLIIEQHLKTHYPNAKIDWKSPIKEFLN